ncbi:MAG: YARHG domain-containing protein [Arenimonas sp.]
MSSSKVKTLAYSLSVITGLMLAGCKDNSGEQAAPVVSAPEKPAADGSSPTTAPETVTESALIEPGLYSGRFEPTAEFTKAREAFDKWAGEDAESEYIMNLKDVPKQFHPFMYLDPLYGYYAFITPNRLSIVIDEMRADKTFSAHSVAAGNQRPITGTWEKTESGFHLAGSELGDDKNDGSFDMVLDTVNLSGTWKSKDVAASPKAFKLERKTFVYNPKLAQEEKEDEYVNLGESGMEKNPSIDTLKTRDVENLTQPQIRIIRNFIFARHGYSFNKKDLRLVFEAYDWYVPVSNDVKAELTDIEKANLALLTRYEKYADKHYDEFGR